MTAFSVKFSDMENTVEVLSHYAVQLNQAKQEIASARRNLSGLGSSSYRINSILMNIEKSVMDEALGMRSLSGALGKISAYYRDTENRILSGRAENSGSNRNEEATGKGNIAESIWNTIRGWFVSWGIIRAEKQVRTEGEAVTRAQQKEMDRYLQGEIADILRKDRYSRKSWNKATVEERKAVLNEYLQEVAGTMGLQIGAVEYTYSEGSGGTYNMGAYYPGENTVKINEWVLENGGKDGVADSYTLMSTIVHEMRHAYQHAACRNPEQFVVTEETIRSWQDSINNYKSKKGFMAEGMNSREAYRAYRNQTIEVDARWFAKQD